MSGQSGSNKYDARELELERQAQLYELDIRLELFIMEDDVGGIEGLITQGADVNYVAPYLEFTPAHKAVRHQSLNSLKCLANHGANMNALSSRGESPLFLAIWSRQLDTVRYLIEECRVATNNLQNSPIHQIAESIYDDNGVFEYLIHEAGANVNASSSRGETDLHYLCQGDIPRLDMIRSMLDAGADFMARDNFGNTPLITLAEIDRTSDDPDDIHDMMAAEENEEALLRIIQLLVEYGGTKIVDCTNSRGETALYNFACHSRPPISIFRYLIEECQADVNAADNEGYTPIMRALSSGGMRVLETIRYLINDAGASVLCRSIRGETTLNYCLSKTDQTFEMMCHSALAEAGGRTTIRARGYFRLALVIGGYASASRKMFLVKNILGDATRLIRNDSNGDTALHTIFRGGFWGDLDHSDVILCLVEEGKVDMLATNHDGLTAVQLADEIGDTQSVNTLKGLHQKKIMKMLHFLNSLNWFPDRVNSNNSIAV